MRLEEIADALSSMEESIIYQALERAQLPFSSSFYEARELHRTLSLAEEADRELGRYEVPEERPFFARGAGGNQRPVRRTGFFEPLFDIALPLSDFDAVNMTPGIYASYLALLEKICESGHASPGLCPEKDIAILRTVSRRVHIGAFYVAEAKYRGDPAEFERLLRAGDEHGILELLTRRMVETRIVERVAAKTSQIQASAGPMRKRVDPQAISAFFRDVVIPLTKNGELLYLRARSGR